MRNRKSKLEEGNNRGNPNGKQPNLAEGFRNKDEFQHCGQETREGNSAMREDRCYGHSDPRSRRDVVLAAANFYCSICDATPCYLLTSAASSVVHEQLTENDCFSTTNLIGAVRYAQSLEKLHMCIARHIEVTREAWQMDNRFRVSEEALRELERQGTNIKQLKENLLEETRSEDPPRSLN